MLLWIEAGVGCAPEACSPEGKSHGASCMRITQEEEEEEQEYLDDDQVGLQVLHVMYYDTSLLFKVHLPCSAASAAQYGTACQQFSETRMQEPVPEHLCEQACMRWQMQHSTYSPTQVGDLEAQDQGDLEDAGGSGGYEDDGDEEDGEGEGASGSGGESGDAEGASSSGAEEEEGSESEEEQGSGRRQQQRRQQKGAGKRGRDAGGLSRAQAKGKPQIQGRQQQPASKRRRGGQPVEIEYEREMEGPALQRQ